MKIEKVNIVVSFFLIGALAFAQIGVNFFHRNHDVHENKTITTPLKAGKAAVQKHGEHCKVCSIDCFNHAFVHDELAYLTYSSFTVQQTKSFVLKPRDFNIRAQGRAPPLS